MRPIVRQALRTRNRKMALAWAGHGIHWGPQPN